MFGTSKNSNNNTFQVDSSSNNAFNFSFGSGDAMGGDTIRRTGFDATNTTSQKDETTASVAVTGQGNAQTGEMQRGGDTDNLGEQPSYQPYGEYSPFAPEPQQQSTDNKMLYMVGGGLGFLSLMGILLAVIMKK